MTCKAERPPGEDNIDVKFKETNITLYYIKYGNGHMENIHRDYEAFHNLTADHAYGSIIIDTNKLSTIRHLYSIKLDKHRGLAHEFYWHHT